ncbi:type II toxin-antitoxin system RelE/ParE family toxin [Pandoraea sp. ISTKB]|uniref:type II toxin-antitoxin system RelE/ParE family toxin n=1 Tax=Pandoraea sp. ISTKB TaxID=1586708 RepID=UPI0009F713CD
MIPIFWTRCAANERYDALRYLLLKNASAAKRQSQEISAQICWLQRYPSLGRLGRVTGTREFLVRRTPYLAIYRHRRDPPRIEIMRLLHGARNWF